MLACFVINGAGCEVADDFVVFEPLCVTRELLCYFAVACSDKDNCPESEISGHSDYCFI
jgi:hypothetical protein